MPDEVLEIPIGGERILIEVLDQDKLIDRLIEEDGGFDRRNPYYGQLWPAARVLGETIAKLPDLTDKRLLDVGCGAGLLGIVAAKKGARVTFADVMQESLELARGNARRNGVKAQTWRLDLAEPGVAASDDERFDVIVSSDVLYEPWMAEAITKTIHAWLRADGVAIVTDPMRPSGDRMKKIARAAGLLVDEFEDLVEDEGKIHVVRQFSMRRAGRGDTEAPPP
ncbi:MAG: methyltransferase domain-containing protein [Planctomycetes bacterium]|nr:methyltransferase domain-containing protein [Planctomycetota bacterium]